MKASVENAVSIVKDIMKVEKPSSYVLTGAGASRGSEIPTFRGEDGLWEKYNFEEVATARAWKKNPIKIWTFYAEGIDLILNAEPNKTHFALTKLETMGIVQNVITQNADGLHQKAGSTNVLEIHGSLVRIRCTKCSFGDRVKEPPKEIPPKCPVCSSLVRPDVVLFDEQLPVNLIEQSYNIAKNANLAIIVGTSAEVMPAAYLPILSKENNAKIIVFNKEETEHVKVADVFIEGKSEETLPLFVELLSKN